METPRPPALSGTRSRRGRPLAPDLPCVLRPLRSLVRRLQRLGIRPGDRVAYIAPNTHAHLEAYYAAPQIGAIIVSINYRLNAADFALARASSTNGFAVCF